MAGRVVSVTSFSSATICGETVYVSRRIPCEGCDAFGDQIWTYGTPIAVQNVLVDPAPSKTGNLLGVAGRVSKGHEDGVLADMTIYMPREYKEDLRGARIEVRGREYDVLGAPTWYTEENIPHDCLWNMVVRLRWVRG